MHFGQTAEPIYPTITRRRTGTNIKGIIINAPPIFIPIEIAVTPSPIQTSNTNFIFVQICIIEYVYYSQGFGFGEHAIEPGLSLQNKSIDEPVVVSFSEEEKPPGNPPPIRIPPPIVSPLLFLCTRPQIGPKHADLDN